MHVSLIKRLSTYAGVCVLTAGLTLLAVRARAAGIPQADALTYTGYLENPDGTALTGKHAISVRFLATAAATKALCTGDAPDVDLVSGRFQVPLPDCADVVTANPDLFVDVSVDGAPLGPTKLGAVPYAIEAAHATAADNATSATGLAVAPTFFSWATLSVPTSNVETLTPEGAKTVTFDVAGYYRITLNAQGLHDPTLSIIRWYLSGTATRLDNFAQEAGGKDVQLIQSASGDSRQVSSTVLFVKATKGQTIKINPALTCQYSSGNFHQANFMYATEYLGPL